MTSTARDSSGNGQDGTYNETVQISTFVAGLVPGDLAYDNALIGGVQTPDSTISWLNAWTFEIWSRFPISFGSRQLLVATADVIGHPGPGDNGTLQIIVSATQIEVTDQVFEAWIATTAYPNDGDPHHVVVTFDGTSTLLLYIDGTLMSWDTTGTNSIHWHAADQNLIASAGNDGIYDEYAAYDYVLDAGRIAAHFAAAASSFAAYTAEVLADTPNVYYHFNDRPAGGWAVGRIGVGA